MSPKRSIVLFLLILQQLAVAQSLQPDPGGMVDFNVLGDSFFQAHQWEQARIHYEEAFTKLDSGEDSVSKQVIQRKIADALRMESKFELASEYYFRALQELKALEAEEELIATMAQISVHLSSTDPANAIAYADSALARARTLFPNDSLRIIKYLFQLADRYRTAIEYEECVTRYSEVLNLLERLSPTDSFLLFNAHFRLGGVLCRLDRRAQSLHQYEIAEKLLLEKYSQDEKLLRNFYQDVAFLLEDMGDFGQALEYRQRYCDYFFARGDSTSFEVSRAMNNLGLTHERRGEYEQAMYWYQKVLHNNRRIYGPVSIYTAFLLNNVGNIYKHLGEYEKGLPLLKEAYKIFSNYFGEDHVYPANVSSNIGNVYNLMGQPMQALPYNLAALNIRKNKLGPYHEDLSRDYQLMGDIYSNLQDYASAIRYYDSAAMATKYLPETGFEPVISHHRLYQSMEKKAHAQHLWYDGSRDLELLKEASAVYQKIDAMTDFVRNSFKSEGSKRFLLHRRRSIYEDAVADLTILYEETGDTFYFDEALRFSEKTRSILLFEALLSSRAENFGNIPGKLRADITIQRQRTSELEKQFFELQQNKTADSEKINKLEGQLFTARNEYQRLIEVVASNHPAYFNLKYQVDTRSGQDAQALLSDDQVFLEYLIGSDHITVFIISSEKKVLIHLPLDFPLRQWIKELRESIYGYVLSPQKSRALFDSLQAVYVDRAQVIYDKILRPIEPYLENKSTIIISPDQELNYLPFATLLFAEPENMTNFKTYPYLLQRYAVHYVPSLTLWYEMENRQVQSAHSRILAFAPSFDAAQDYASIDATRSGLGKLGYNALEVAKISDVYSVESYVGRSAVVEAFLAHAPDYSIVHLATHGKANDREGDFSYLAFANDTIDSSPTLFYAADIYNLQLNADMVVLSACETGIGELQRGEGIISLARAFSYAGAKSIVTTLWAVNDQSTSDLMLLFYDNLNNRNSKATSLQKAKMQYLKQTMDPVEAHPFYWAGIISMGAANHVVVPVSSGIFRFTLIGVLAILLIILILYRSKGKSREEF